MNHSVTILLLCITALLCTCSPSDESTEPTKNPPGMSVDNITIEEGLPAIFTVTIDQASPDTIRFRYATRDGSADLKDYSSRESFTDVTIAPGSLSASITIPTYSDSSQEPDETFSLVLSNLQGARFIKSEGLATITNSDRIPLLSMRPLITAIEGSDVAVMLTLSKASPVAASFTYVTRTESASSTDFAEITTPKSVSIAPGDTKVQIRISTVSDNTAEAAESFSVTLSDFTNVSMAVTKTEVYILEDSKSFFMNAKIDGKSWTALPDGVLGASFSDLSISGTGQNFSQITLVLYDQPTGPKHYKIGAGRLPGDDDHIATVYTPLFGSTPGPVYWGIPSSSGELNLLEMDLVNGILEGTFNFICQDNTNDKKVTVTEGVFRLPMNP